MAVPVLKQGEVLIATVQEAVTDSDLSRLADELAAKVGQFRARGVVVDVSQLDVIDSLAARSFAGIAQTSRLRGADTVVVGIQPGVAFAMTQLGLALEDVATALDLEEALALLAARRSAGPVGAA